MSFDPLDKSYFLGQRFAISGGGGGVQVKNVIAQYDMLSIYELYYSVNTLLNIQEGPRFSWTYNNNCTIQVWPDSFPHVRKESGP